MSAIREGKPAAVPEWNLADRLGKARRHAGLKQADLAKYLGLSARAISGFELGVTQPRIAYLRGWAELCGVDLDWLANGSADGGPGDPPRMYVPAARAVMSTGGDGGLAGPYPPVKARAA